MDLAWLAISWILLATHLRDEVARFPDHATTMAMREHCNSVRWHTEGELAILFGPPRDVAYRRSRQAAWNYMVWDALDDCHRSVSNLRDLDDCRNLSERLMRLRRLLGDEAYFSGEMP